MKISVAWLMSMTLIILMASAIQFTQKKQMNTKEKSGHFECGFNSLSPSHLPFSFQFFLVALLFLIFDVEISLVMIYPLEQVTTKNLTMIYAFLFVLTIGLLYEWQKGKINWSE